MTTRDDHPGLDWVRAAAERYEGPLILYAQRFVGNLESARDVVQDAFVKLCSQDRAEVEGRVAEWLYTVCRNRSLDVLKKERRMGRFGEDEQERHADAAPDPSESAARREEVGKILGLIERLPANQREVIRLKFQEGFSYREISRISGHSVTNVGYLIHSGLKTIRRAFAEGRPAAVEL